ncbi:MAG TPA: DUF1080 domain-containing protein [Cyclobacteriaceae bacterium]
MKINFLSFLLLGFILLNCKSEDDGWVQLFDGETMEGWHVYGKGDKYNGWYVENGVMAYDPELRSEPSNASLVTDKKFTNFELSIEWMIAKHGNSGIFWGVIENEKYEYPYETGPEIQILDDNWEAYINQRGDINRAGSLYGLMAPKKVVSKPAGEWNHFLIHIDHKVNLGYVIFNGEEVVRFPVHGPEWEKMIANSGFSDWPEFGTAKTGKISIQEYGGEVAFRNIKIRELP